MTSPSLSRHDKESAESAPFPHPPLPEDVTHAQLLSLIQSSLYSHEVVWHVLNDHHPEWLSSMPPGAEETPLHALVRTGNVRLLEMMLAEVQEGERGEEETTMMSVVSSSSSSSSSSSNNNSTTSTTTTTTTTISAVTKREKKRRRLIHIDLNALDARGKAVKDTVVDDEKFAIDFPEMASRIKELIAFEEAHDLAVALRKKRKWGRKRGGKVGNGDEEGELHQLAARLLHLLSHDLSFISSTHHKAWSVLHHLVAVCSGVDDGREEGEDEKPNDDDNVILNLLKQIMNLPSALPGGKIRPSVRTRDCGRSVWDIALGEDGKGRREGEMEGRRAVVREFMRVTLGPMCGVYFGSSSPSLLPLKEGEMAFPSYPSCSSSSSCHPPSLVCPGSVLVKKDRVKTILFIRHAEGTHNQAAREEGEGAYKSWAWEDAELTTVGIAQAQDGLRRRVKGREGEEGGEEGEGGTEEAVDLVVVSPLRRTLHTAMLAFGDEGGGKEGEKERIQRGEGEDREKCNGSNNNSNSRSSSGGGGSRKKFPPFVAMEAVRETAGMDPCNKRSNVSYLTKRFPLVDFSEVTSWALNLNLCLSLLFYFDDQSRMDSATLTCFSHFLSSLDTTIFIIIFPHF